MNFKENLKDLRIKNNLTQDDIATRLNISRQSISKWESGVSEPNLETLEQLCDILNCSLEDLVSSPKKETKEKVKHDVPSIILTIIASLFWIGSFIFLILFLITLIKNQIFMHEAYSYEGAHNDIGLGGIFEASRLNELAKKLAEKIYGTGYSDVHWHDAYNQINSIYTLHGNFYFYNDLKSPYVEINYIHLYVFIALFVFSLTFYIIMINSLRKKCNN